MNITRLFVGPGSKAELTHVGIGSTRVRRTADELAANVADLSEALSGLGVRSGDAVLVLGGCRVELAESILALFNIGAIAVPVSPLLGPVHINSIITRMRPRCCIFEDPPEASIQQQLAEGGALMIAIKPGTEAQARGWRAYRDLVGRNATRLVFPVHAQNHPALIVHGSGSSGALKAIAMSHERLLTFCEYNRLFHAQYSDGPDSLMSTAPTIGCLPLTHLAGLGNMLLSLMNGLHTYLLSSFLPEVYLRLLEEARCSYIFMVPSLYRSLLKQPYLKTMDKSALRFCVTGGEPSTPELLAQIVEGFGVTVATAYSMTECLSGISHWRQDLFKYVKPGSCGRQFIGESSLRDANGNEHPRVGELWVRNPTVHACYLDPKLNEERLRDGWFRTGDLFERDEDGDFFHRGRADDMFICNGKNIYPVEIEQLLSSHPRVEMACAAPVEVPGRGTVTAVMIVTKGAVAEAELQEFFMRRGASHAVPQVIRFTDALPVLGPGKLDRRQVRRLLQEPFGSLS